VRPIRKILFITLSNIGDCILTLPVLDLLKAGYPGAAITVLSGPRPRELFEYNPVVSDLVVYDKHAPAAAKLRLFFDLAGRKFDMAVDMRNSLLSFFLPGVIRVCGFRSPFCPVSHMKDVHLARAAAVRIRGQAAGPRVSLPVLNADRHAVADMLAKNGIGDADRIVIVSAGSRSATKQWPGERFAALADRLTEAYGVRIVLIGDAADAAVSSSILQQCRSAVTDLTGKTTLSQTAALLQRAALLITNDSANSHLASYLDIPVAAVFGPTDDRKYRPWSRRSAVVKKEIFCRPCCKAQCRFGTLACLRLVTVDDVFRQAGVLLAQEPAVGPVPPGPEKAAVKRILVVRTDRMGDLVLSTPVFRELRMHYPGAYLAALVRPYTRAVVEANPYIDEVIAYDKKECDRNICRFFRFIRGLRQKRFDCALVLHPTNRDHVIAFLSGIPRRIGYNRKMGFLLTDRIIHDKQFGKKHESDYALDMVRTLGIEPREKEFFVPCDRRAEKWADDLFRAAGIRQSDRVIVINPGASCPSKIWPPERYAAVADALAGQGRKIVVLAGPDSLDKKTAQSVIKHMNASAVDCIDKAPIPETASIFRRSSLVISADTGPMHIAAAIGVPVIAIFGRNQPGISPRRWGPVNKNSVVLHKDAGCAVCLAHDCTRGFACLSAITVAEVLAAADKILENLGDGSRREPSPRLKKV